MNELKLSGLILNPDGPTWKKAYEKILQEKILQEKILQEKILGELKKSGGQSAGELGIAGGGGTGGGSKGGAPTLGGGGGSGGGGGGGGTTADCVEGEVKAGKVTDPAFAMSSFPTEDGGGGGGKAGMGKSGLGGKGTVLPCGEISKTGVAKWGISKGNKELSDALAELADAAYWQSYHSTAAAAYYEKAQKAKEKGTKSGDAEATYAKAEAEYQDAEAEKAAKKTDDAIEKAKDAGATDEQIDDMADMGEAGGAAKAKEDAAADGAKYNPEASGDPCNEIADALAGNCSSDSSDCPSQLMADAFDEMMRKTLHGVKATKGKAAPVDPGSPDVDPGAGVSGGDCGGGGGGMMPIDPNIFVTDPPLDGGGDTGGGGSDPCAGKPEGGAGKGSVLQRASG